VTETTPLKPIESTCASCRREHLRLTKAFKSLISQKEVFAEWLNRPLPHIMNPLTQIDFAEQNDSVLIVDDDVFMLKVLHRVLQKDYTLYQAGSAEEAIAILRKQSVKAILCDHVLPGQSGLDFLIALRRRDKRVKTVLFSAALETEQFVEAIHQGKIFRFIKKPASPADIAGAVRAAVRQYDIEELEQQVLKDQKEIDRQIYEAAGPHWLYRLRVIARQSFRCETPLLGNVLSLLFALGIIALSIGIGIAVLVFFLKNRLGFDLLG